MPVCGPTNLSIAEYTSTRINRAKDLSPMGATSDYESPRSSLLKGKSYFEEFRCDALSIRTSCDLMVNHRFLQFVAASTATIILGTFAFAQSAPRPSSQQTTIARIDPQWEYIIVSFGK